MKYYKVTGKARVTHSCNCRHCTQPDVRTVEFSVFAPGPDDFDESADRVELEDSALAEQYRAMGLIDETDNIYWVHGEKIEIREARPDEVMVKLGAPRLPGFEEV